MAYIIQADLTEQLAERDLVLLTNDNKTGIVIADRVARAIASAEGVVNGYVGARYTVPLTGTIPDLVQKWTGDIAKYFLYQRRRVPEDVRQAYEDAIASLRDVATGKMTLGIEPAPTASAISNQGAVYGPERVFTREKMEGF